MVSQGQADDAAAERVREALRLVIDPELGMNVVDLGLVYRVDVASGDVRVTMTMTTPACPLGETLRGEAEAAIRQHVPDVRSVALDLVWDPPWTPGMMSDAARKRMGWTA
jgi:metal-sulfur cluster biosynthetic enzyme